jgi:FixJ family two-component response regulator
MESAEHFAMEFASAEELLASGCTQETDCLILDVQLPGLNRLDLQIKLGELGCRLPIVFVTAHGTGETRERAMREGAADLLIKPLRRESLLSSVRQPSGPGANENEETDAG